MAEVRFSGALERFSLPGEWDRFFAAFFGLAACSDSTLLPVGIAVKREPLDLCETLTALLLCDTPFSIRQRLMRAARIEHALASLDASSSSYARCSQFRM